MKRRPFLALVPLLLALAAGCTAPDTGEELLLEAHLPSEAEAQAAAAARITPENAEAEFDLLVAELGG